MATQLSILDAIAEGELLAQEKMHAAVAAANRQHPGWKERCWKLFKEWVMSKPPGYHFMIEDFRESCKDKIETPKSNTAFGFLSVKANRDGLIQHAGTAKVKNKKAHRTPANVWSVI